MITAVLHCQHRVLWFWRWLRQAPVSVVMLLIFFAGLLGAPLFISLRLLGGGAMVGVGARGVCSGMATGLALFLDFWLSLLMCVLGGTSRSADGTTPTDPGREGNGPSSETETLSYSPSFHFDAGCACRR
jgi:hypothetical protein